MATLADAGEREHRGIPQWTHKCAAGVDHFTLSAYTLPVVEPETDSTT
jgi:hypothetical protein